MQIKKVQILVRDLVKRYEDFPETNQVVGYDGNLQIRASYNRQFVYNDKQRDEVLRTIISGFPLSIMYWAKTQDGWEVLDGQQRSISICQYVNGDFTLDYRFFHNLTPQEQDVILDYKLDVYQCDGTDAEKLAWFKVINIAGVKLTDQELRNAVYAGTWLGDAKKKFSAPNCAAYRLAKDYVSGAPIRQEYLEKALKWISSRDGCEIEEYMAKHQHDSDTNELWLYFQSVINWVKVTFPVYRKEMRGVEWGLLFNEYEKTARSAKILEDDIARLMLDDDVTNKKGIYAFVLSGEEKHLSIRAFSEAMKRIAYERQKGICPHCAKEGGENARKVWDIAEMQADHITPWVRGGRTISENCQCLCRHHNATKSGK